MPSQTQTLARVAVRGGVPTCPDFLPPGEHPGRFGRAVPARPTALTRHSEDRRAVPTAPAPQPGRTPRVVLLGVVAGVAGLACLAWCTNTTYNCAQQYLRDFGWGYALWLSATGFFYVSAAAFVWRAVLVWRYHPCAPCADDELPTCAVIVPAYNEGRQVLMTLRSIVASDYPTEKLTIIAVDDGSVDDTWRWLRAAVREYPERILALRQPHNRGKRRALYEGFRRTAAEILVTVDSDSQIEPQTLRRLVSPFVTDRRVGAVAGNVRVLNRAAGLIPRMLDVSFTYSFDFVRASQNQVNAVMCTPGALSAYRRDVVAGVLAEWLDQRFCGRPASIGEDRAMTNLILRSGCHVRFQRDAVVYTNVPTSYRTLCRMFLRWARSNVRETLVLTRFAFRRFRTSPASGARINLALHWLNMTLAQALKLAALGCLMWRPGLFGTHLAFGAAAAGVIPAMLYARRYRSAEALWSLPYSLLYVIGLWWIPLYAWLTPHKTAWMTRQRRGAVAAAAIRPVAPTRRLATQVA